MNVIPITRTYDMQGAMAIAQDTVLQELDVYHEETSPALKVLWENRQTKSFSNDTVFQLVKYALAPGGSMPRNHTFTLENIAGPVDAQFDMKIMEAHTSLSWFDMRDALSPESLYDMVKDNISTCVETLWKRLSYSLWSPQNETVPGTGIIDANTYYTTFQPDVTYYCHNGAVTSLWDGIPLAARGNTATHTYGGLGITASSTNNAFWQAHVSNGAGATDDYGTSGTGRAVTTTIVQNHIGAASRGAKVPTLGAMPYNVWTSFNNVVHSMGYFDLGKSVTMNALGIEDSIPFRGTEYYSEPWMTDRYYDSTAGGSIIEWGPDSFGLLLHTDSEDPVLISDLSGNTGMQGFQHLERSTIFFFGLFLWGNFVAYKRHRIRRLNNLL